MHTGTPKLFMAVTHMRTTITVRHTSCYRQKIGCPLCVILCHSCMIATTYSSRDLKFLFLFLFLSFFFFLGLHSWHMEVPELGVKSELQLPAYTRATTATRDPSRVCDPLHSSTQRRILNPLSKGRDRTRNLMVPSWIR